MRRLIVAAVALSSSVGLATVAIGASVSTGTTTASSTTTTTVPKPTVVRREIKKPPRVVRRTWRFKPWARPTRSQVYRIIDVEARGSGSVAATLHRRIDCESSYDWRVINGGGYAGLGQFASETFYRGMRSIGSRKVRLVDREWARQRTVITTAYSDGQIRSRFGGVHRVRYITVRKGTIPRNPERRHGWAQIRIMARAIRGQGEVNNSEWSCQ